jgi:hypothetical protein
MGRIVVAIALAITAQSDGRDLRADLARARDMWAKAAVRHYELAISVRCFCLTSSHPERFSVYAGSGASPLASLDRTDTEFFDHYNTIEKLFAIVETAIQRKAAVIRVTYHAALGYPARVVTDQDLAIADDELAFEVVEFEPLGDADPDEVTTSQAARALLRQPERIFGSSVASVLRLMRRDPIASELTAVGSTQEAVPDAMLRLDYGGLVVTLHIQTLTPASRLFRVDITDMSWLGKLGLKLPESRLAVLEALGPPHRVTPSHLLYQQSGIAGGNTLRLTYEGDRLMRVGWAYFID